MTANIAVVVNRGGGAASKAGDALIGEIQAAFAAAGVTADIHIVDGRTLKATVERLSSAGGVLAIGGGDGTQGCAAAILAAAGAIHGILPLGTRNNLARELGIPLDLVGAAQVIARGKTHAIDLGAVNGQIFVNNASIGLYPRLVEARDAERKRLGVPKWVANVPAAWAALARLRHHRFRITLREGAQPIVTPLLFIGNNVYSLDLGSLGTRGALNDGLLSVYAVAKQSRWSLIGFALRTLAGRSDPTTDFAVMGSAARVVVASRGRRRVKVALDGEVWRMSSPLIFANHPGALRVFIP